MAHHTHRRANVELLALALFAMLTTWPCYKGVRRYCSHAWVNNSHQALYQSPSFTPASLNSFTGRTRNLQRVALHHQVVTWERELKELRKQLAHAEGAGRERDAAITSAEAMVQQLQQRAYTEQAALTKAQLGLAEKSNLLQTCYSRKGTLGVQLEVCSTEVTNILVSRTGHLEF